MIQKIGDRIRTERKAKGLSIKKLAQKCGVSTMTLQRIETGKTSPSVALLSQIAQYLLQPIDFFIKEENPKIRIIKKNDHRVVEADNVQLTVVAPIGFIQQNLFVNMVEAKQGRFVESHTDDGYSFIYILEGTIVLEHDSAEYKLEQGDSFYFDASYPHSVTATSAYHKAITIFFKGKK